MADLLEMEIRKVSFNPFSVPQRDGVRFERINVDFERVPKTCVHSDFSVSSEEIAERVAFEKMGWHFTENANERERFLGQIIEKNSKSHQTFSHYWQLAYHEHGRMLGGMNYDPQIPNTFYHPITKLSNDESGIGRTTATLAIVGAAALGVTGAVMAFAYLNEIDEARGEIKEPLEALVKDGGKIYLAGYQNGIYVPIDWESSREKSFIPVNTIFYSFLNGNLTLRVDKSNGPTDYRINPIFPA